MSRSLSACVALVVLVAVGSALVGCGQASNSRPGTLSAEGDPSPATAKVDPEAAALVPADIKAKGSVVVAGDAVLPPFESLGSDGKTMIGIDPDLAREIFALLGLRANMVNGTFETIIPGLASGKYDIGMSSFTDTKEREKVVNFVTYMTSGLQFFTRAAAAPDITGLDSICGLKIAVQQGSVHQLAVAEQAEKCLAEGASAPEPSVFRDQTNANLALASGRVDAAFADAPIAGYQVEQSAGNFKLAGSSFQRAPLGIAVPKDSGTLALAIQKALEVLIANGKYREILDKWGVRDSAIDKPAINGAAS